MDRLDVLCDEGENTIVSISEEGIRNLGKFRISGDKVDYSHLDDETGFAIGLMIGNNLRYSNSRNSGSIRFNGKLFYLMYFVNEKPRYLFNVREGVAATIDVE